MVRILIAIILLVGAHLNVSPNNAGDIKNAIQLIHHFEGFYEDAYLCPAGVETIGYGTTIYPDSGNKVRLGDKITLKQAEIYLYKDLYDNYIPAIVRNVKVPLTNNQFEALVSFVYNVGETNFRKSTLLKKLNNKDYDGASHEFDRWVYANGKRLNGLVRRRKAEKELFRRQ